MVEFMLIALPRSGTTWASNWLTTDKTLCLHDPLFEHHYKDLDSIKTKKKLGIACTGSYLFSDYLNSHQARKVILHRPLSQINTSLNEIGLASLKEEEEERLYKIKGLHLDWQNIFTKPKSIYEFLLEMDFDEERHEQLVKIEMQPKFSGIKINKEVTRSLVSEMREILCHT